MKQNQLTTNLIASLLNATISKRQYHLDGVGLYLQLTPPSAASWIYMFTKNGKRRELGLGSLVDVTLDEARVKARAIRKKVKGLL